MAAQFIGLHMRVVLREPAGYQLTGTVRDVEAGSSLTLTNVFVPGTKSWAPEMRIDAHNIADLGEIKTEETTYYPPPPVEPVPAPAPTRPTQPPLDDPAILSLGRPPTAAATTTAANAATISAAYEGQISPAFNGLDIFLEGISESDLPGVLKGIHVGRPATPLSPILDAVEPTLPVAAATPAAPLLGDATFESETGKPTDTDGAKSPKKRRRRAKKNASDQNHDSDTTHDSSAGGKEKTSGRGKGWRQTPMLQSTASFQPYTSLKRNGRGQKGTEANGWASEEVTEEMGEFDFENNLAKFDKRTIFDQMRKEDKIEESSRLVSHNRRPKPGTNGGKNLHPTENVLDIPTTIAKNTDFWNSEADDLNGHGALNGLNGQNGGEKGNNRDPRMAPNRRAESKNGVARRSQSRKASGAIAGSQPLSRVNSAQAHQRGLYLMPSNRRLEPISALQMINLENIAANEVGFTEDLMAENAGRGIAEVAVRALSDPAMKVRFELAAEASLASSTTVILGGNNKSTIRALAAARHLRNRNIDVVICMVGIERERELLEDLRRQIDLYRSFGGKVMSKAEFFEYLRKNAASGTRVPISLIVDAMIGMTMSFEELRVGDQATVYELMEWANRNEAFVLAVDVPSGIDPSSGKISIIDGGPLFVKPRYVVSVGAPKRGLLEAMTPPPEDSAPSSYAVHEDDWRLFIADMGLGSAVWKKAGTKIRRGIDFDGNWVLEMEFRASGHNSGD